MNLNLTCILFTAVTIPRPNITFTNDPDIIYAQPNFPVQRWFYLYFSYDRDTILSQTRVLDGFTNFRTDLFTDLSPGERFVVVVNESTSASFSHTFTGLKPSELYQGYVIGESFGVMGPTTNISFSTGL